MRGQIDAQTNLEELYTREAARLWRSVFAFAQDRAITDDAVAEAFAQCLRRGSAVRDPAAWVWRAAFRIAAGELKERGRTQPLDASNEPLGPPEEAVSVLQALSRVSANQRAVIVLHYYAGYPTDEIATMLGIARATVRVHMSRAHRHLRDLLEEEGS